jgi:hypothetical protein
MRVKLASLGCLTTTIIIVGAIAVVATVSPMAFGFFVVMAIGIIGGALAEIPFESHEATVVKYEEECAPAPRLISTAQPKCTVNGKEGAMLKMIYLRYEVGGENVVAKTKVDPTWGEPEVGSKATILVNSIDSSQFQLKRGGWLNPGYCGDGVCP